MPARARHRTAASARSRTVSVLLLPLLAVIALAAGFIPGLVSASAAPAIPAAVTLAGRGAGFPADELSPVQEQARLTATRAQLAVRRAAAIAAARTYAVRPGDSLSAVAARHCGQARDWTGIYAASRARGWTARNANVLARGQHLYLACAYLPSMLRFAPAPPPPPVVRTVVTAARTVSTGHGYAVRTYHRRAAAPVAAASSYSGSGTYSFSGLEALWVSAGGPAWAESHAASIAECESGGRVSAYNPSGATGLWQILGAVVPGNLYNAFTNALNAVSKFRASGDTFAQWVCQ